MKISRSPWVLHYDGSSCNGCDIEVLACLTPLYDIERFGAINTGNPKHADILLITGSVNSQNHPVIQQLYEQMPDPKVVVAVGILRDFRRYFCRVLQYRRWDRQGFAGRCLCSWLCRQTGGYHRWRSPGSWHSGREIRTIAQDQKGSEASMNNVHIYAIQPEEVVERAQNNLTAGFSSGPDACDNFNGWC